MGVKIRIDPGVRVDDSLWSEQIKAARSEKIHGVAEIQCHAEDLFTVTLADGTVKKMGAVRLYNLLRQERAAEPARRAIWAQAHASNRLPRGADERMARPAPLPLSPDAAHRRKGSSRW